MNIKNIDINQKKIIIIAFGVFLLSLVFWFFIYTPAQKGIRVMKTDLGVINTQIKEIESIISEAKSVDEGIRVLKERSEVLKARLPRQEEGVISVLSDLAKKTGVEIISINPQSKTDYLDDNGNKIMIGDRCLQSMLVPVELICTFKDLIRYMEAFRSQSPAFITIESLTINKGAAISLKLNIRADLKLYLLS
jgi:Tfp pilus assembly protein PilO